MYAGLWNFLQDQGDYNFIIMSHKTINNGVFIDFLEVYSNDSIKNWWGRLVYSSALNTTFFLK